MLFLPSLLFGHQHLKKTTLQLGWFNQFQFAGYYMAKEKGFYSNEGIDVEIKEYSFSDNITKNVSEGVVDFGIGKERLVVDKINHYSNIVALYPLFQISPLILVAKKTSNIHKIADLANKNIMLTVNDLTQASLKSMIKSHNIDMNLLKFISHSYNIEDFLNNDIDAISGYISKIPYTLEKKKIDFTIFSPHEYGFNMYSDFLFTRQELIENDFDRVMAFKQASLKGWEYAYNNIEETIQVILEKYNTQNLSKEELLFEAEELKKLSYYKTNKVGKFEKSRISQMFGIYNVIGDIHKTTESLDFIFDEEIGDLTQEEHNYLQRKETLKMCVNTDNLPYEDVENFEAKGMIESYIQVFEEKLNKKIIIVPTKKNLRENYLKLHTKECDIMSLSYQKDKIDDVILTKPYLKLPFVYVSNERNSLITNFEMLQQKKIYISTNSSLKELFNTEYPSILSYSSPTSDFAFKQILVNKADGYIGNIAEVIYALNQIKNPKLTITGKFDNKLLLYFGVRKDDLLLHNILDKVLEDIPQQKHDFLLNNYTILNYKEVIDYRLLICAGLIIVLLGIFYLREKQLKNKIKYFNDELQQRILDESIKNRKKDEALFKKAKLASMGNMINNIAHQWRQPLNRVNLSIQIIETLINKDTTELLHQNIIDKKFASIHSNIKYMSTTIEDFIHFFHPKKERNEINLHILFKEAISLVKIRDESICFQVTCDEQITIVNFENEIIQVILVILENAIDNFEVTKLKNKFIHIETKENNSDITIFIKDNSGGISQEIINKIFEPYFTTKYEREGSGIGLYMAKILIEESIGGQLDVKSEDRYTSFKICIPKEL